MRWEKTPQELGYAFQDDVQAILEDQQRRGRLAFHRFYDTKSARSYLPDQPGDFLAIVKPKGRGHLIEVKCSTVFGSLADPGCLGKNLTSGQAGYMFLWSLVGAVPLVLFKSEKSGAYEIWDGLAVRNAYVTPKRKLVPDDGNCLRVFHVEQFETALITTVFEKGDFPCPF